MIMQQEEKNSILKTYSGNHLTVNTAYDIIIKYIRI